MSESILTRAEEIINGQRAKDYGDARENHLRIATLWSAYKQGVEFSPEDVAVMMILLKIARFMENGYHEDTVVDIAGYAGVLEKMQLPKEQRYGITVGDSPEPLANWERELLGLPREWDSVMDIPTGVPFTDIDGDEWVGWLLDEDGERELHYCGYWGSVESEDDVCRGPYTEVVEPRKWGNVNDIPFGVRFESVRDGGGWKQIHEKWYQYYWADSKELAGSPHWTREAIQHYAPFAEVLGG